MKLTVLGLGQCGSRIADEFVRLNKRAYSQWGTSVITGAFAVNTDKTDMIGLSDIGSDYMQRILIGTRRTGGHGVGKINESAADVAREDGDKVVDAMKTSRDFYQTHAFLLIAGAAGGTGSGTISVIAEMLKERYIGKPVFALLALPFEHEELHESRGVYNTAVCLKSIHAVADAVFLADNQRFLRKDVSMALNIERINSMIVEPFYNLLCAGEARNYKNIGAKTVDAGDIVQSLDGWTTIGTGTLGLPIELRLPWEKKKTDFREKTDENLRVMQAMDAALSDMSIDCKPDDAGRAMYLVSGPASELTMDSSSNLGGYLRELAPNAVIRAGDFPGKRDGIDVTIILSQLAYVQKIRDYYDQALSFQNQQRSRVKETTGRLRDMEDAARELPSLI